MIQQILDNQETSEGIKIINKKIDFAPEELGRI